MACSSESSVSALPELELSELEKEQIVIVIPSPLPPGSTPPPPTPTLVMSSTPGIEWGGGGQTGLVHNLLMQFFSLYSSKIEVSETCFFLLFYLFFF